MDPIGGNHESEATARRPKPKRAGTPSEGEDKPDCQGRFREVVWDGSPRQNAGPSESESP